MTLQDINIFFTFFIGYKLREFMNLSCLSVINCYSLHGLRHHSMMGFEPLQLRQLSLHLAP